ncbi:MAG: hypothetical protein WC775_06065 [Patescibacteria group bacterium]
MVNKNHQLGIATYNIQFSQHPNEVVLNILRLSRSNISIFALQEVLNTKEHIIKNILAKLGSNWKAVCNLGDQSSVLGMGNCLIWDTKRLQLIRSEKVFLPKSKKLALHELVFSLVAGGISTPFQRRAIVGYFKYSNNTIRISNIHLDHNGGQANRESQLNYIRQYLARNRLLNHEILCGDFNSFDLLKTGAEFQMHERILGDKFLNVSKNIQWTADLNSMDIKLAAFFFKTLIKMFNLHIRRKLDHIWIANLRCASCVSPETKGSDHNPLLAYLNV